MPFENEVSLPEMRTALKRIANVLCDTEYQKDCWGVVDAETGRYDDFDAVVSFLFDDAGLDEKPVDAIGQVFRNDAEALACEDLVDTIDHILTKYGNDMTDLEYVSCDEWKIVVAKALKLSDLLSVRE